VTVIGAVAGDAEGIVLNEVVAIVAAVGWVGGFGLAAARFARRVDRSGPAWLVFGAILGPIALLLLGLAPHGRCQACANPTRGWPTMCAWCGERLEVTPWRPLRFSTTPDVRAKAAADLRPRVATEVGSDVSRRDEPEVAPEVVPNVAPEVVPAAGTGPAPSRPAGSSPGLGARLLGWWNSLDEPPATEPAEGEREHPATAPRASRASAGGRSASSTPRGSKRAAGRAEATGPSGASRSPSANRSPRATRARQPSNPNASSSRAAPSRATASGRAGASVGAPRAAEAEVAAEAGPIDFRILTTAVYVTGSSPLVSGCRYIIGIHGPHLRILGPVDVDPSAVTMERSLAGMDATANTGRLVVSDRAARGPMILVFTSIAGTTPDIVAEAIIEAAQTAARASA
jgi:hypothetical protein